MNPALLHGPVPGSGNHTVRAIPIGMEVKPAKSPTFSLHSPLLFSLSLPLSSLSSFLQLILSINPLAIGLKSIDSFTRLSSLLLFFFLFNSSFSPFKFFPTSPFLPQPGAASSSSPCLSYSSARGPSVVICLRHLLDSPRNCRPVSS